MEHTIHLNLNVRGLKPSATLHINELSNQLKQQGKTVYKLGLGQSPFPVPDSVVAALQQYAAEKDYLPVKGLWALREAVAKYYQRTQQIHRTAESILIGPGSKELMFNLQLAYYGDLLIPSPSWVSYAPQARIIGRQIHWLPTRVEDGWRLLPETLAATCRQDPTRPRLLILNYPSNPTGRSYEANQAAELAAVAREYQVILLSDEIYGEVQFDGSHRSIAEYYPEGTIISGGLSKWCGAGGWRLGLFSFPEQLLWLQQAMTVIISETFTSVSAPIQYAAITAFNGNAEIEQYLTDSRRVLKAVARYLMTALHHMGAETAEPQGGFYLFPSFAAYRERLNAIGIHGSNAFCDQALQATGVAMLPASDFGVPDEALVTRMAFVDFDGAAALKAAAKLSSDLDEQFVEAHCPMLCGAMTQLARWLETL